MTVSFGSNEMAMPAAHRRFSEVISHPAFVLVIVAMLVGVLWSVLVSEQRRNQEAIQKDAEIQAGNLARAFEEHVVRTFRDVDAALKLLRQDWVENREGFDEKVRLMQAAFDEGLLVQIALIGADGRLTYSNLEPDPRPVDLSDREHFQAHRGSSRDFLFISKPVLGRVSGRHSIQMTRPVRNAQGGFEGVLVISLSPDYFSHFFGSINLGHDGAISLVGTDGVLRARGSNQKLDEGAIGTVIPVDRPFLQSGSPVSGSFEAFSLIDGIRKIFVFRHIEAYSMVVVFALSREAIFAEHYQRWSRYRLWVGFFSLLMVCGGGLLARALYLQRKLRGQLLCINESLRALNEIAIRPAAIEEKLQGALDIGRQHFGVGFGCLSYLNKDGIRSCYRTLGSDDRVPNDYAELIPVLSGLGAESSGEAFTNCLGDADYAKYPLLGQLRARSYLRAPVLVAGEPVGAIYFFVQSTSDHQFCAGDVEFMRLLSRWVSSVIAEDRCMNELRLLATTDALTGVKSRGCFMDLASAELSNATRHEHPLSLVLIDLDHFKHVNDSFGHSVGDETLRRVASICQEALRAGDIFARLGGEEFAVLLPNTCEADAIYVAERLREAVAETTIIDGHIQIKVTISAGVGQFMDGEDFSALYNRVDVALYDAKELGRNRIVSVSSLKSIGKSGLPCPSRTPG